MSDQEIKSLTNGAKTRQEPQPTRQQPIQEKIVPTLLRQEAFYLSQAFEQIRLEKTHDQYAVSKEAGHHDVGSRICCKSRS